MKYELLGMAPDELRRVIAELVERLRNDSGFREQAVLKGMNLGLIDEVLKDLGSTELVKIDAGEMGISGPLIGIAFSDAGSYVAQDIWDDLFLPAVRREMGEDVVKEVPSESSQESAIVDESPENPRIYRVYYGTNRKPKYSQRGQLLLGYTSKREVRGTLHVGKCDVAIPRAHRFGTVGPNWWTRWLTWGQSRLEITKRQAMDQTVFWETIGQELQHERNDILLFIHGYNVSFDEAAICAAQIGVDLKTPGITAFFSWPSRGRTKDYLRDEASIAASEAALAEFLVRLSTETQATKIHILAPSMGNRGLVRAVQRIAYSSAASATTLRFGQLIMAAADEDVDLFMDLAPLFGNGFCLAQRYTSHRQIWL